VKRIHVLSLTIVTCISLVDVGRAQGPTTNVALKKTATASSTENNHPAADAIDGKPDTRWCAADGTVPQWWKVDLGAPSNLDTFTITWEYGGRAYQYLVEGSSDDKEWHILSDQQKSTDTSQTQKLSIAANGRGMRYVRVTVSGVDVKTKTWASFNEVVLTAVP
jgi:hypothetical protein